ncbi:MAG TPA: hypothetical protein DGT21_06700 [Armatimonadetes bacterium]|nr:hypothetical protein [Armatimonadota bacterium]
MPNTRVCRLPLVVLGLLALMWAMTLTGCHSGSHDVGLFAPEDTVPVAVSPTQAGQLLGDMDGNGEIGVADAIAVLRIVVALAATSPYADVTQDGAVGVTDAIEILRAVVGLTDLPFQWRIATVSGRVAEVLSRNGLQGIEVTVGGQAGTTNAAGAYSIGNVPVGSQAISVTGANYDIAGRLPATVAVAAPNTALATIYMVEDEYSPPDGPDED